jgi:hypothetical protein
MIDRTTRHKISNNIKKPPPPPANRVLLTFLGYFNQHQNTHSFQVHTEHLL